jgi:hypothetical protein
MFFLTHSTRLTWKLTWKLTRKLTPEATSLPRAPVRPSWDPLRQVFQGQ